MGTIIKIVERSTGEPDEADGKYIESFDPLWNQNGLGVGHLVVTEDDKKALVFEDAKRALEFWKQQSPTVPIRPDGKPNRPLTAFTVVLDNAK
jgi:hypothetical protein